MTRYEELCMAVCSIANANGLDYEVRPMRKKKYKDGTSVNYFEELEIVFTNNQTTPSFKFSYYMSPYIWDELENNDLSFEAFCKQLKSKVEKYLIRKDDKFAFA